MALCPWWEALVYHGFIGLASMICSRSKNHTTFSVQKIIGEISFSQHANSAIYGWPLAQCNELQQCGNLTSVDS